MKIVILPDSFKGTLSSIEVCNTITDAIHKECNDIDVISYPFGDGGENTLDCFRYMRKEYVLTSGNFSSPFFNRKQCSYLLNGKQAIMESAKVIGLQDVERKDPLTASTYGLGEMILDALCHGVTSFIITLGGSCTNDGGAGMLAALGMSFHDSEGKEFIPTGGNLNKISHIDMSHLDERLSHCHFRLLSDVRNPLLGKSGASHVFARQKGASEKDILILEENMTHYAEIISKITGKELQYSDGMGAAGGLTYAFASFFDHEIISGAKAILDLYDIEHKIDDVDLIITGEGKTDSSSFDGKCIQVIADLARKHGKKVLLVSGYIEKDVENDLPKYGFHDHISIQKDEKKEFSEIRKNARKDLYEAVVEYIRENKEKCSIWSKY